MRISDQELLEVEAMHNQGGSSSQGQATRSFLPSEYYVNDNASETDDSSCFVTDDISDDDVQYVSWTQARVSWPEPDLDMRDRITEFVELRIKKARINLKSCMHLHPPHTPKCRQNDALPTNNGSSATTMRLFITILTTLVFIVSIFGAPFPSGTTRKLTLVSIKHNEAAHTAHEITMPTNTFHYRRTTEVSISDHTTPAPTWYAKIPTYITSHMPRLPIPTFKFDRRGGKETTVESAKFHDKTPCWAISETKPDECVEGATGKVYTTAKEQKKGEDLEQAKGDPKMWEGHLHWDGEQGKK